MVKSCGSSVMGGTQSGGNETYTDGSRPEQEALRVDPFSAESKSDSNQASPPDDNTDKDRHDDDIKPPFHDPLLHSLGDAAAETTNAFLFALEKMNNSLRRC